MHAGGPAVRVDVLETVVELLGRVEADGSSDAFYSSLCEAVCRVSAMDRAVIFRYDEARRRVRAAGAYGLDARPLRRRARDRRVRADRAPGARGGPRHRDRRRAPSRRELPADFHDLLDDATLVCAPLSAGGRWFGVILADRARRGGRCPTTERHLLWTLGKIAALAEAARAATFQRRPRAAAAGAHRPRARGPRGRDPAAVRRVARRSRATAELPREARERIAVELQAALRDLRRALQRPLGRQRAGDGHDAARGDRPPAPRAPRPRPPADACEPQSGACPRALEPLAQSVLAEAVRNAHKHATPTPGRGLAAPPGRACGRWRCATTACTAGRARPAGMGLQLAALEALQAGGIVEFGEREPGTWRVRLAVPLERP